MISRKARAFWPLFSILILTDCTTKRLAESHLLPVHSPHEVAGDILRFTLAYNPGAAFGFSVGPASRWIFTIVAIGMTGLFLHWYFRADSEDREFATVLALVAGGAVGNLIDRLRSARGVVDFIDIGFGDIRFWTFNVADMALTLGAVLLAMLLWRREEVAEPGTQGVSS